MAKKILAAVLAVMIALSAMAITAFADVEIPLYPLVLDETGVPYFDGNGLVYDDVYKYSSKTITLDIPVTGLYGYMTQGSYFELTLPRAVGDNVSGSTINWSVIVAGQEYSLESQKSVGSNDNAEYKAKWWTPEAIAANNPRLNTSTHRVYFGIVGQNYNSVSGSTTVPQTAVFGGITSIRVTGTVQTAGHYGAQVDVDHMRDDGSRDLNKDNAYDCGVIFYDADGNEINGSHFYLTSMNPQIVENTVTGAVNQGYAWASGDWTTRYLEHTADRNNISAGNWFGNRGYNYDHFATHPIVWDHTLANRAAIASSASDTVKLVVELYDAVNGGATYSLWAFDGSSTSETIFNYTGSRKYITEQTINGKAEKLEFDVPIQYLNDSTYGWSNVEFVIFENITLFDRYNSIMASPLRYSIDWGTYANAPLDLNMYGSGSLGKLGWAYGDKVMYDGEQVRYAAGGMTDPNAYLENYDTLTMLMGLIKAYKGTTFKNAATGEEATDSRQLSDADLATVMTYVTNKDFCIANGIAYLTYNQDADLEPAYAKRLYLLIPEAPAATETVDPPTEQGDTEEDPAEGDDMNVDDGADETPAAEPEQNPVTGVALALVPMMIAAAAAVVSKKH